MNEHPYLVVNEKIGLVRHPVKIFDSILDR